MLSSIFLYFLLLGGFFFCAHLCTTYKELLAYSLLPIAFLTYGIYDYSTYELTEENDGAGYAIGMAIIMINVLYLALGFISTATTISMAHKGYRFKARLAVVALCYGSVFLITNLMPKIIMPFS